MAKKNLSLGLIGQEELKEMLAGYLPNECKNILRATVQALATRVRNELRTNVKKDSRGLEKSIRAVRRRGSENEIVSEVRGGSTAPYMLMLEYGTKKTKAQPFINPTVEQIRPSLPRFYREEFGKKLEKAATKRAAKSVAALSKKGAL